MAAGVAREAPAVLLSFDVEEFDAPEDFGVPISRARQLELGVRAFATLLDLLDALEVPVTLFVTVAIAREAPELVRRAALCHEIASHGVTHEARAFTESHLAESRAVLASIAGVPVRGFRRPRFAPTRAGAIAAAGYTYDASENPIWLPGRYDRRREKRTLHRTREGLWEVPVSATPWLRVPLFWLAAKTMPMPLLWASSRRCLAHDGYLSAFFHPWELLELGATGLPRYVRLRDGAAMAARITAWVRALARVAVFQTTGVWLAART